LDLPKVENKSSFISLSSFRVPGAVP